MDRYHALHESVHLLNCRAIILVSSNLPHADDYQTFFSLTFGLNFCHREDAFLLQPTKSFSGQDNPKRERFSRSNNIHPNGPCTEILEKFLQQAMSPQYLLEQLNSRRVKLLAELPY